MAALISSSHELRSKSEVNKKTNVFEDEDDDEEDKND